MNELPITLDVFEIELTDFYLPHLIDLNALFEACDLHYHVEIAGEGVVEVDLVRPDGMLFLTAAMNARSGERTKVTVSAVDFDGRSRATSFDVVVVDLSVFAA